MDAITAADSEVCMLAVDLPGRRARCQLLSQNGGSPTA